MSAMDPGHSATGAEARTVVFLGRTELDGANAAELSAHLPDHRQWLDALERRGRLLAAGPLLDDEQQPSGSGVVVVRAASLDEAAHLLDQDPFHIRGLRTYRLNPWWIKKGALRAPVVRLDGTVDPTRPDPT